MVFSSMLFVFLFFTLCILIHSLCRSMKAKNIALLLFSLVFYSWAALSFVLVLLFNVAVCWLAAIAVDSNVGKTRKRCLFLGVAVVLMVLAVFKYSGFIVENVNAISGMAFAVPQLVLPLGISFYTFQLISYLVDVYRGDVPAQPKFWMLLLYASLFHQCVAGPIVRYGDVMEELEHRRVTARDTSKGITRFTVGLAKKAILANSCAVLADTFFVTDASTLSQTPVLGLWLSAFAYMFQIYLDFSAYSDMALGMGLMCGFHYRENFNYPYLAGSVTDFWRRWHMSLSSFFRDYVYIPLGGSRCSVPRHICNLFVVWFLTGLWHGASWNYILWGLYFFVLLVFEKYALGKHLEKIPGLIRHTVLLFVICICWVLFRFEDLNALILALKGMFGANGNQISNMAVRVTFQSNWVLLLVSAIACTPLMSKAKLFLKDMARENKAGLVLFSAVEVLHPVVLLLLSAMALTGNSYNPFIYWMF